jgi:hypothetical protein
MRKVVPLLKTYNPVFYLEMFETGKIKLRANQFRGRFKSNFEPRNLHYSLAAKKKLALQSRDILLELYQRCHSIIVIFRL